MPKQKSNRPDQDGPERGIYAHNKALLRKTATICALCGLPLDKSLKYPDPMSISIDHIIPVALGGKSTIDNLQATHRVCNREKGTKLLRPISGLDLSNNNQTIVSEFQTKKQKECSQIPQYVDWKKYSEA